MVHSFSLLLAYPFSSRSSARLASRALPAHLRGTPVHGLVAGRDPHRRSPSPWRSRDLPAQASFARDHFRIHRTRCARRPAAQVPLCARPRPALGRGLRAPTLTFVSPLFISLSCHPGSRRAFRPWLGACPCPRYSRGRSHPCVPSRRTPPARAPGVPARPRCPALDLRAAHGGGTSSVGRRHLARPPGAQTSDADPSRGAVVVANAPPRLTRTRRERPPLVRPLARPSSPSRARAPARRTRHPGRTLRAAASQDGHCRRRRRRGLWTPPPPLGRRPRLYTGDHRRDNDPSRTTPLTEERGSGRRRQRSGGARTPDAGSVGPPRDFSHRPRVL